MGASISFRPLAPEDLPTLVVWFNRPHVFEWWGVDAASDGLGGPGAHAATLAQVTQKYGARRVEDREVSHFLILRDDRPIGMIQWYPIDADPEYAAATGEPGTVAIDYLIGEVELTGRGVGPIAIRGFVEQVVRPAAGLDRVVASPSVENTRSIRALEKAGFTWTRDAEVGEPAPARVMVLDVRS